MTACTFPEPDLYLPDRAPSLRWGVLAPGRIAVNFVAAAHEHSHQRFVAAGSRSLERAQEFAQRFGIERAYGSYEEVVADPAVDVVYVAAPLSEHLSLGLLAVTAGKHTVIEKPLATNSEDARVLVEAARSAGVFLMEAMWTRYLPKTSVVRRLINDGVLGDVRTVFADLSHAAPVDRASRLYRPDLGGGALLDLGIYPLQLSSMVLGRPHKAVTVGGITDSGVDAFSTSVLVHGNGARSTLVTSMLTRSPSRAYLAGTEARIEFDGPFHVPGGFTIGATDPSSSLERWEDPTGISLYGGLSWEATAAATFISEGRAESPEHTLAETVEILETADELLSELHGARGDS